MGIKFLYLSMKVDFTPPDPPDNNYRRAPAAANLTSALGSLRRADTLATSCVLATHAGPCSSKARDANVLRPHTRSSATALVI